MNKNIIILMVVITITGCATLPVPEEKPFLVSGIPISMNDTDWYLDYCTYSHPVDSKVISYGDSCGEEKFLYHAFMHKVRLMSPMNENGKLYKGSITFALTGGKLISYNFFNQEREYFLIQNSPEELKQDTGIKYIGIPASYDEKNYCIYEYVNFHTDHRKCKDPDFHPTHQGQCLSMEIIIGHYSEFNL